MPTLTTHVTLLTLEHDIILFFSGHVGYTSIRAIIFKRQNYLESGFTSN